MEFPGLMLAGEWVTNDFLLAEAALYTAKKAASVILSEVNDAIVYK